MELWLLTDTVNSTQKYKREALVHNAVKRKAGKMELLVERAFVLPICAEDAITVEQLQTDIRGVLPCICDGSVGSKPGCY